MAEIYFRLPSKVPYGYAEIRFEHDDKANMIEPQMLASMYANYVMAFAEAERAALDAYGKPEASKENVHSKVLSEADGASLAIAFQGGASEENVHETACTAVSEGLGATVISEEDVRNALQVVGSNAPDDVQAAAESLLAMYAEQQPPWKKKAKAPDPKEWEAEQTDNNPDW